MVSNKEKLFRMKIRLEEVIIGEEVILLPLFTNGQMISGIDKIKSIADMYNKQLHAFIDDLNLVNNTKKNKK